MKKGCETPWFCVCVDMEHTCQERKSWYYQHDMWWHVRDLQKKVERREQAFKNKYFEKDEEINDSD
jgi:hypothetical protein